MDAGQGQGPSPLKSVYRMMANLILGHILCTGHKQSTNRPTSEF